MKKNIIGLAILIILIIGGGYYFVTTFIGAGVVGRIEYFEFDIPLHTIKKRANKVIQTDENIEIINSDKYVDLLESKNNNTDNSLNQDFKEYYSKYSYISITDNDNKFIFRYNTKDKGKTSQITLVSAATFGEGLDLAKNIGYLKKREYLDLFERKFISKLKNYN